MALVPLRDEITHTFPPSTGGEYRRKIREAEQERATLRADELASQVSPMKHPEERIRIWERLHALRLPRSSSHVLVRVIATQTHLTIGQVHEEQRRRTIEVVSRGEGL
jgi:hypothetical protein